MQVQGYAALFGVPDLEGDVIHAGAFRDTIARCGEAPMLLRHEARLTAGVWRTLREDGRGLFVRGEIVPASPAGLRAMRLVTEGMDGLSIGFRAVAQRPRPGGGRDLYAIDLIEISIVPKPMAPRARLTRPLNSGSERMLHA